MENRGNSKSQECACHNHKSQPSVVRRSGHAIQGGMVVEVRFRNNILGKSKWFHVSKYLSSKHRIYQSGGGGGGSAGMWPWSEISIALHCTSLASIFYQIDRHTNYSYVVSGLLGRPGCLRAMMNVGKRFSILISLRPLNCNINYN